MPIGYIVGKQYKLDYNYDRYARLEVWSLILRQASLRGYSLDVRYSHLGRNYSAEVSKMDKIKDHWFMFSRALKHESNPLSAMIAALVAADVTDELMLALYLEGELEALRLAWEDAKDREAKQEALVDRALDYLRRVLDTIPVTFLLGEQVISTHTVGELRSRPLSSPLPANPDEDDDL